MRYPAAALREASQHRKEARRLGLNPPPLGLELGEVVLVIHPAHLWGEPADLAPLLERAGSAGATVYRLDLALDFRGLDAESVRDALFPSLTDPALDPGVWDALALPEARGELWRGREDHAARYLLPRTSPVNLAAYSDRPSKLEPDGPPAFHLEVRAQGEAVPLELLAPPALLHLKRPALAWYFLGDLLEPTRATPSLLETLTPPRERVAAVVGLYRSKGAPWCELSAERIAELAGCAERTVWRALAALTEQSPANARGGRGRTRKRRPVGAGTLLASRDGGRSSAPPPARPTPRPTSTGFRRGVL